MSPHSREAGLLDLLVDTYSADDPPLEWLARYAQDPASLPAEQRTAIEQRLAESPVYAEELRALQRLAVAAARVAAPVPVRAPVKREAPSVLARLRASLGSLFEVPPARWALVAGAAAALFLAVYTGVWQRGSDGAGTGPVVAQRPESPPPEVPVPRETGSAEAGVPDTRGSRPEEVPAKPPPPAPVEPEREEPRPAAKPERIMLAMALPEYRAPAGAIELGTSGGIIRGAGDAIELRALAPEHAGLSATPTPVLLWNLSELPAAGAGSFELLVQDPSAPDPLLQLPLEVTRAGIQQVDLAEHGAELAPGIDYAWSVAFRADPLHPSRDPFARGWVRYEPAPAALTGASPAEAPRAFAAQGYWYDALARVHEVLDAQPDDPSARSAWDALLSSAAVELE
jgi:hypothetical protein